MTYLYVTLTAACLLCWSAAQDTRDAAQEPPSASLDAPAGPSQTPDTFSFAPALRAEAFEDFSVGFELRGLTSQGAQVSARLTAGPNPEDQLVNAALSYAQPLGPLLTADPLTLRTEARSDFTQDHPLALTDGRTYTQRLTRLAVGLEQPLGVVAVGLEARVVRSEAFLENRMEGGADEVDLLPNDVGGVLGATLRYSGGVKPGTPGTGSAAELALGYGLGEAYGKSANERLAWGQGDLSARGYLGFDERGLFGGAPRFVLAARLNAGANIGDAPLWRRLSPDLRGYDPFALVGERYVDLSADLRYHTGLSPSFGDGFAIFAFTPYLFVDAGDAWGGDPERRYRAPELDGGVQVSFGAGAQIGLETPFAELPLNIWYVRGGRGGALGFEIGLLY